jgi:ribosome-associated translation inhibitor RaiA
MKNSSYEIELGFPLQVQFRDIAHTDAVENAVWIHAEKLERLYNRIVSCHVVISAPHRRRQQGRIFHVQVRLALPGESIFVNCEPEKDESHEEVYVAIHDAFAAVQRKLADFVRRRAQFEADGVRRAVL